MTQPTGTSSIARERAASARARRMPWASSMVGMAPGTRRVLGPARRRRGSRGRRGEALGPALEEFGEHLAVRRGLPGARDRRVAEAIPAHTGHAGPRILEGALADLATRRGPHEPPERVDQRPFDLHRSRGLAGLVPLE